LEKEEPKMGRIWDKVRVKENPATYLVADAEYALGCARSAKDNEAATRFARLAILMYAFSLEGFVNFVYEYSEVEPEDWRNLSFKEKWLRASSLCLPCNGVLREENDEVLYRPGDPIESFLEDADPFISFLELKAFRDRAVHLKARFAMVAHDDVEAHLSREEYYPCSGLPKLLEFCTLEHAESARRIYNSMTEELNRQMKGTILNLFKTEGSVLVEYFEDYDENDEDWPTDV
jgi:hypothetical protein